jgi:hypothetical protein
MDNYVLFAYKKMHASNIQNESNRTSILSVCPLGIKKNKIDNVQPTYYIASNCLFPEAW